MRPASKEKRSPEHNGAIKRIARNVIFIFFTKVLDISAALISTSIIARYLGIKDFGEYSFVMAFVTLCISFSYAGLEMIVVRELAKDRESAPNKLGTIMLSRWFLVLINIVLITAITVFMKIPPVIKIAILVATISQVTFSTGNLINSVFRAYEKMEYETFVTFIYRILFLCLIVAAATLNLGFIVLFVFIAASNLIRTIISSLLMREKFLRPIINFDFNACKTLLKDSLIIGLNVFFMFGAARIDIIFLKIFSMPENVALFNAPFNIVLQLQVLPIILMSALFPAMSKFSVSSKESLVVIYKRAAKLFVIISLLIVTVIFFASREIIFLLYGEKFEMSTLPFKIMIWGSVFLFLGGLFDHLLIAINKQRYITISSLACLTTNIILGLLLIPKYGHIGAAIVTLVSHVILTGSVFYFIRKEMGNIDIYGAILKPIAAVTIMILIFYLTGFLWLPFRIACSVIFYFLVLFVVKAFTVEDIAMFKTVRRIVY